MYFIWLAKLDKPYVLDCFYIHRQIIYFFRFFFFFHFTLSGLGLLNHSDKKVLLNNIKITRDLL